MASLSRVAVVIGAAVILPAAVLLFSAGASADTTSSSPSVADAASAPDAVTAAAIATQYGHPVVIDADYTQTREVAANPDGTETVTESSEPTRVEQDGVWTPIDTDLALGADGSWAPQASAAPVEFSAGGSTALARVQSESGSWLSESWPGGSLPTPTVSGSVATYPEVYPGVDLRLSATPTGMSEVLVVKNAQAALDPQLAAVNIGVSGATLSATPGTGSTGATDGSTAATASNGLISPSPSWWDSAGVGAGPAGPGGNGVPMPVPDTVSSSSYSVNVAAVAQQSGVTFPVYVDPSFDQANWAYVDNAYPAQSYWNGSGSTDGRAHVGFIDGAESDDGRDHVTHSFWTFDLSGIAGTDVLDSHFNATEVWSYSCSTTAYVDLYQVGAISSSTTWNNQPTWQEYEAHSNNAYGYSTDCPANTVGFEVQSAIQHKADIGADTITFGLRAHDETNKESWKKFKGAATLTMRINHLPSVPGSLTVTDCGFTCGDTYVYTPDANPVLYAKSSDADGDTLKYEFQVQQNQSGTWTTIVDHTTGQTWAAGDRAQWTETQQDLTDGSYRYHVQASDGTDWSTGYSDWFPFTVDRTAPSAPVLSPSGGLSTSKDSVTGTVGVTLESITITPKASDNAYGYAYAIYPNLSSVVFPTNLSCNTSVDGYTTVCPSTSDPVTVGDPVTVKVHAPDDQSVFAAITFDAAGNAHSAASTVSFYASGDYTSANAGHSWLTENNQDTSGDCAAAPIPDSAVSGQANLATLSGTACWGYDPGAPAGDGSTIDYTGNGMLGFTGASADAARTAGQVLDSTHKLTVAAWVKPGALGTASNRWFTMLSQDPATGGTDSGFYLQIAPDSNGDHHWRFCMRAQDASRALSCVEDPATNGSGWTYVSGTYDAQNDELLLHVFGGDSPGTPFVGSYEEPANPSSATGAFTVGQAISNSVHTDQFIGEICDPVAVQGVMDTTQLQKLADLTAPANLKPPIAGS